MTVQATVGSTVLASAVGVGTTTGSVFAAQSAQSLAFTGASHTVLLVTIAALMIVAGVLMNGLARRHSAVVTLAMQGAPPPEEL